MSNTILVAVDGSKNAAHAGEQARLFARDLGAELVVLRVHEVAVGRFGRMRLNENDGSAELAQSIIEQAKADGVNAHELEHEALYGHVAHRIARTADEVDARMIVVGTHGRSETMALVMGSTAHKLMHETMRPVLAVPLP